MDFVQVAALAFVCECIDAALGMGYGTILAPVLAIAGIEPIIATPAILFSQACGGFSAAFFHHRFANVSFLLRSFDLKFAVMVGGLGIIATIAAAMLAMQMPPAVLKWYIAGLVIFMGSLLLLRRRVVCAAEHADTPHTLEAVRQAEQPRGNVSGRVMVLIGVISAFNKGLSGGGFGPVVTAGQILAGRRARASIGVTTLAEAPICLASFCAYVLLRTVRQYPEPVAAAWPEYLRWLFSAEVMRGELLAALTVGAMLAAPVGPWLTSKIKEQWLHRALGIFIIILGLWMMRNSIWR
ncbi:MAG: sulfite exporter TauE/SafE family protein [Candidatus Omnitrophica bacterium]|nr:sulfite exporter TauE/SafE family protein [Candidatus Omnitrophota bacterium]